MKTAAFAAGLVSVLLVSAAAHAVSFSTHGYYRLRIVGNDDLDLQTSNSSIPYSNNRFGFIQYNEMRLRLEPTLKLNDWLSIQSQFDVLDNVLFGTEDTQQLRIIAPVVGEQTLPPGAGSFYMTGPSTVGQNGAINLRRLWADILTPIGKFRVGRQPSNWGLGIFQNDGNEMQGDFGDTADRIMWLIQYDWGKSQSFTGGILWDIAYEAQFDPRIQGLQTAPVANSRDTQQYAAVLMYNRPEATVGLFSGIRRRNGQDGVTTMTVNDPYGTPTPAGIDGDTFLYFFDIYGRYTYKNYNFKLEGIYIGGDVTTGLALDAIPFAGLGPGEGIIQLPPKQPMQVFMAAFEADAHYDFGGSWSLKTGYAPGDANPLSAKVTQLGFRPDYQIALMMFNMPLGTSPALYGQKAGDPAGTTSYLAGNNPITGNYINNAFYVSAGYKHRFDIAKSGWGQWLKVGGRVTTAWAPKKNTNIDFADLIPQTGNWPTITENTTSMWQRWYGLEFDISAEAKLFEFLYTALEGGILIPGREYNIDVEPLPPGSIIEPIPYDKASMAWMIRLSTIIEF